MLQQFKRIASHSIVYGLAGIFTSAIGVILTPLYAHFLIPAEYGAVTILTITASFAAILFQIGTGTAVFRLVIQKKQDRHQVFSTAFIFTLAIIVLVMGMLILFSKSLGSLLVGSLPSGVLYLRVTLIAAGFDSILAVPLTRYRIEEKSIAYAALTSSNFTLGLALNIYFVAVAHLGIWGICLANLIRAGLYALIGSITLIAELRRVFSISILKELLRFGVPQIPVLLSGMILSVADRYFLQYYSSMDVVGVYSIGYKLGSVLSLPVGAVLIAWPVILFEMYQKPRDKEFFSRLLTYFCLVIGSMALVVSAFAPETISLISGSPGYFDAWQIVPYVTLSQLMLGIYYMTAIGVNVKKRPEHLLYVWLVVVAIHLGLNFVLIRQYGMFGAALSTLIGYTLVAIGATAASLRLYTIHYEYVRLLKLGLVLTGTYLLSRLIPARVFGVNSIWKLLIILIAPVSLWIWGFFTKAELEKVASFVRSTMLKPNRKTSPAESLDRQQP